MDQYGSATVEPEGCHPGTTRPLGTVANEQTRNARIRAHSVFDQLWNPVMCGKLCFNSRKRAYEWLAKRMKMHKNDCHISMFSAEQCEEAERHCLEKARE